MFWLNMLSDTAYKPDIAITHVMSGCCPIRSQEHIQRKVGKAEQTVSGNDMDNNALRRGDVYHYTEPVCSLIYCHMKTPVCMLIQFGPLAIFSPVTLFQRERRSRDNTG